MGWSFTYFSTKPELRAVPKVAPPLGTACSFSPARRPDALTAVLLPETTKEWRFVIFHFHDSNGCWNKVLHINKYRQVPDWGHATIPFFAASVGPRRPSETSKNRCDHHGPRSCKIPNFPQEMTSTFRGLRAQMSLFCRWSSASKEFFLGKFGGRGCRCTHLMVWLLMIVKIIYTSLLERCRVVHAKKDAHLADKWTCNVMHSPLMQFSHFHIDFSCMAIRKLYGARSTFG